MEWQLSQKLDQAVTSKGGFIEPALFKFNNMQIQKATRKLSKIKMAITGPAGSGKTYSALQLAKGLTSMEKVCVIDTENGSSHLYADLGPYSVISICSPFSPENYEKAIDLAYEKGFECIILDSLSHGWEHLLDYHSRLPGNSFTNWSKVTPRHRSLVQKILSVPVHVISTLRVKQDYALNLKNGKYVPEKVGLKAIQRDGIDYEFTLVFDLDIYHNAKCFKDRTGLFKLNPAFIITTGTGRIISNWCNMTDKSVLTKLPQNQIETEAEEREQEEMVPIEHSFTPKSESNGTHHIK
jgi:hypothetical protein